MKAWVLVKKQNKTKQKKQTNMYKKQKSSPFCLVTDGYVIGDRQLPELPREVTPDPMGTTEMELTYFYSFYSFRQMDFSKWNVFWSLCFGLLSFLIIVGNALSITILFKRRLRKRPHFLLISLAFADLLVGLIPVPLYIMSQANLLPHTAYPNWVYLFVDMITGLSSVFTLTAISLERLYAISRPLRHRQLTLRSYAIAIATPWIFSFIVSLSYLLSVFSVITNLQFFSGIIISLSTSLLATCISYCLIWRKQATRIIPNEVQARKDFNLNRTLLLISAIFVFSWLPFHVLNIVSTFCSSCEIFLVKVYVIKFLHYSNSFMNFLVYCFRMPHFRKALLRMLHKCRCSR